MFAYTPSTHTPPSLPPHRPVYLRVCVCVSACALMQAKICIRVEPWRESAVHFSFLTPLWWTGPFSDVAAGAAW